MAGQDTIYVCEGEFSDPRYEKKCQMPLILIRSGNKLFGFGFDEVGVFLIKNGNVESNLISFTKVHQKHEVKYRGEVDSLTPFTAHGTWELDSAPRTDTCRWSITSIEPDTVCELSERPNPNVDDAISKMQALSVDDDFAKRPKEARQRENPTSSPSASSQTSQGFVDTKRRRTRQDPSHHPQTKSRAGIGKVDHGGAYGDITRFSMRGVVEADHIPPVASVKGTDYDIVKTKLPAVTVEFKDHRKTGSIIGTTGSGTFAKRLRESIQRYLLRHDFVSAVKLNILSMYGTSGLIPKYYNGFSEMVMYMNKCQQQMGRGLFLADRDVSPLKKWLGEMRDLINSSEDFCTTICQMTAELLRKESQ
ncbi:uncharacterized protein LOC144442599 [Glandiceps talaboti]